ncbi:tyrosinase family oxidase copper chaperone [Streptomyces sp. NPDC050619]|uniref:tyrosinase family oxidase copper chaperone n=1 Tax=Streptomyces sp. NPDC050619 TaxID=3157214 RepID=UPI003432B4B7
MVVSTGGVPVGAKPPAAGPGGGPARGTRRELLRGLLVPAAALAFAPVVAASGPSRSAEPPADVAFEETYRGRRIRGIRISAAAAGRTFADDGQWHVTVDGRPLHLMRRADGTWLSMVDHYRSYPTPLEAARAAVDELGPGGQLRDPGLAGGGPAPEGGPHGVHA